MTQTTTQVDSPHWEKIALTAMLAVFVVVNVLTASRSPTVWNDEVVLTDPAASLYLGEGFHSTAYPHQSKDHVTASNGEADQFLLFLWMKIFGFSPTSVRSMNVALMAVAVLLTCAAARLSGAVKTPGVRLILAALLMCGWGITFSVRSGRYDILGVTEIAGAFFLFTLRNVFRRNALLMIVGMMIPWTGLQIIPFVGVLGILILMFFGWRIVIPLAALAIGIAIGLASFYVVLSQLGEWQAFLSWPKRGTVAPDHGPVLTVILALTIHDYSLPFLFPIFLLAWRKGNWRNAWGFGLAALICIPLAMRVVGYYPLYYSWMTFVPVAVALTAMWGTEMVNARPMARRIAAACIGMACLIGLPARLALVGFQWRERDYGRVEDFVARNVKSNDVVYCDFGAYYPVKRWCRWAYLPGYVSQMSEGEKRRLTVMIVDPKELTGAREKIGGEWREAERLEDVPMRGWAGMSAPGYEMAVYRRINEGTQP